MVLWQQLNFDNNSRDNIDNNSKKVSVIHQVGFITSVNSFKRDIFRTWIVDSGITSHITSFVLNFISYIKIQPIIINLPNSSQIVATHTRVVKLNDVFLIENVLYISSFTYYLISISKPFIPQI